MPDGMYSDIPFPKAEDTVTVAYGPRETDLPSSPVKAPAEWSKGLPLGPITIPWVGVAAIAGLWFLATKAGSRAGRRRDG